MKRPKYHELSLLEFQDQFATEEACRAYVIRMRWPEGFICRCGSNRSAYKPSRNEYQCYACDRVTSVTAGTLMHKTKVPLRKWFWCFYLLATSKKAVSTLYLSQQLGVNYRTAWGMRHKIQTAMAERDKLWSLSGTIETDEIFIGGKQTNEERRKNPNKTAFFLAVEEDRVGRPRFASAEPIRSYDEKSLSEAIDKHIPGGATLKSDGQFAYNRTALKKNCVHEEVIASKDPELAAEHLHWINIITSNLKRYLLSTHHGVRSRFKKNYVAEFLYRFNRRFWSGQAFDRLLFANLSSGPAPVRGIQGVCA